MSLDILMFPDVQFVSYIGLCRVKTQQQSFANKGEGTGTGHKLGVTDFARARSSIRGVAKRSAISLSSHIH